MGKESVIVAAFCLTKEAINKFLKGLQSGEINPEKLADMSSGDRRNFLSKYIGKDNSKSANALFESKLLLKNQKAGYITWAKKVGGISTQAKRDLISRIERIDKVLSPQEEQQFMADLAEQRLGVGVTEQEAQTIFEMSKKVRETRAKRDEKTLKFSSSSDRLDYGAAKISLFNYVNDLKKQAQTPQLKERLKPDKYLENISDLAGLSKSLKASLDNSAIFRQGWKTLWTNPLIWQKNARGTFVDFAKTLAKKDQVMDGIMADIVSRPNYDRMAKGKLAVGTLEEPFPSALPERVPLLGRIYKGSQTAYTGFIYKMRADIFDQYIEIAERSGVNIDDPKQLQGIAKVINSLTGRADFGRYEKGANVFNNLFFSPRFLKSQYDVLTAHITDKSVTPFARKKAATNLVKVIMGTAAVLVIANALDPDSVEEDPRSSDFGKIKIGNTRFDVSGGMASIITVVSRMISGKMKSSTTQKVTDLTEGGYGQPTRFDVIVDFFTNKLSPAASVVEDWFRGKDFEGRDITPLTVAENLLLPIPVSNFKELQKDPNSAPILLAMVADGLGIGTNTYGMSNTDWNDSTGKELKQFKETVGQEKFDEANKKYNKMYDEWYMSAVKSDEFKSLSDEGKERVITRSKDRIKDNVFDEYDFNYEREKTKQEEKEDEIIDELVSPL